MQAVAQATWSHQKKTSRAYGISGFVCPPEVSMEAMPERFKTWTAMRKVFDQLWSLTDDYIRMVGSYNRVPWWGNEISLCSLMTAAAFKAGFVSLGEYTQDKKAEDAKRRKGFADWWLTDEEYEIVAEAKALWSGPNCKWETIYGKLEEASGQVKDFFQRKSKAMGRMTMVFVRPYYGPQNDPAKAWKDWFGDDIEAADSKQISYMSYYLLDPHKDIFGKHPFPFDSTGYLYPGLIVCCRES